MKGLRSLIRVCVTACIAVATAGPVAAQTGRVEGRVTLIGSGEPIAGATVLLPRLGRGAFTDVEGRFEIEGVPAGRHEVFAQRGNARASRVGVDVPAAGSAFVEFQLTVAHSLEEITVTSSPTGARTTREAFNAVTTLDASDIAENMAGTLGEVLEGQPGVAKRSFGPGSSRPIVRGFDGDRVLITQDGVRTGDLSSQSGDHGVTVDPAGLKRVEVIKGPATLLYGTNAIGGVVNAITNHDYSETPPPLGLSGFLTTDGGTADGQAGANGGVEYGTERWLVWAGGGARRTGDYDTPAGRVPNSHTELFNGSGGVGVFGDRAFATVGAEVDRAEHGVPFAAAFEAGEGGEGGEEGEEAIVLDSRRWMVRGTGGLVNLAGFVRSVRTTLSYTDWHHDELESGVVGTTFDNSTFIYRGQTDSRRIGPWSGSLGVWGQRREFETVGAEALAPPVVLSSFAAFTLHELDLPGVRFQAGGRLERNAYAPEGLPDRSFTGVSASAGVNVPLPQGTSLYGNVTRSYRAPALEELYNNGPHIGTLSFEVGNPDLERESSVGIDMGVRHSSERWNLTGNLFAYEIAEFVFPAFTGEIEDGLPVAEFQQADARFLGYEASLDVRLYEDLWLNLASDYVRAERTRDDAPLPRIPPLRGRVGLDLHLGGLNVRPELELTDRQDRVFANETATAGYAVVGLKASYTLLRGRQQHKVSLNFYNIADELYRNHTSFIKDLAPEMGRGVKITYQLRFF